MMMTKSTATNGRAAMLNRLIVIGVLFWSTVCAAGDWGGAMGPVDKLWVYPDRIVVQQGDDYAGVAGCEDNKKTGFSWSEFDEQTGDRIYATLLAAYMQGTSVRLIFHNTGCTAEGYKHMNGQIALY